MVFCTIAPHSVELSTQLLILMPTSPSHYSDEPIPVMDGVPRLDACPRCNCTLPEGYVLYPLSEPRHLRSPSAADGRGLPLLECAASFVQLPLALFIKVVFSLVELQTHST